MAKFVITYAPNVPPGDRHPTEVMADDGYDQRGDRFVFSRTVGGNGTPSRP